MAEKIYKTETVEEGHKADWPNQSDYVEPSRKGYIFGGWDYDWKNQVITANTDIHPIWDKYSVVADANRTLISGEGDSSSDPTKMFYYLRTDSGRIIPDNVTMEKVALSSEELEIQFTDNGTSKEDNKNVKKIIVKENDVNKDRYYRFRAKYANDGGVYSDICELRQVGKEQIILPPFDYLTFTYNWSDKDGRDLDSATVVRNSGVPIGNSSTLDEYYVGYGGNGQYVSEVSGYLKHGGDNMKSGDEGALVKLKDILSSKDYISDGITTLYIDIYANWFASRGNGNMSITFNTYKGNDGMAQDGFIFKPTGDTVLVSTKTLQDINVFAYANDNANKNIDIMKIVYSKVATVEYDIRSKTALLIGNSTRSGRQITYKVTVNDKRLSSTSSELRCTDFLSFNKDAHTGSFKIGKVEADINGEVSYISLDVETITTEKLFYQGATDSDIDYTLQNDGSGGLIFNYQISKNENTDYSRRNTDFVIHLPYNEKTYSAPSVRIGFYQDNT